MTVVFKKACKQENENTSVEETKGPRKKKSLKVDGSVKKSFITLPYFSTAVGSHSEKYLGAKFCVALWAAVVR